MFNLKSAIIDDFKFEEIIMKKLKIDTNLSHVIKDDDNDKADLDDKNNNGILIDTLTTKAIANAFIPEEAIFESYQGLFEDIDCEEEENLTPKEKTNEEIKPSLSPKVQKFSTKTILKSKPSNCNEVKRFSKKNDNGKHPTNQSWFAKKYLNLIDFKFNQSYLNVKQEFLSKFSQIYFACIVLALSLAHSHFWNNN